MNLTTVASTTLLLTPLCGFLICGCGAEPDSHEQGRQDEVYSQTVSRKSQALTKFEERPTTVFSSCGELNDWDGLITENVVFPEGGCTYYGQLKFATTDVTLDCRGSTIQGVLPDGQRINNANNPHRDDGDDRSVYGEESMGYPLYAGIVVARPEKNSPYCREDGPLVQDINILNCNVQGFYQGIRLQRKLRAEIAEDGSCKPVEEREYYTGYVAGMEDNYWDEYGLERDKLYERGVKNVRIANSTIEKNAHAGIYVIAYSQYFSIENSVIQDNSGVGIYLSHESRYNTIRDSQILRNGGEPDHEREGIAVDSSAHNTISHNIISGNAKAGIALYKNCGEYDTAEEHSTIRKQHSDYNRIIHNQITHHSSISSNSGYGIWLAMRQAQEYRSAEGEFEHCRDIPYSAEDGTMRNHDYANFNTVAYNVFAHNYGAIRVEDDFNQIVGNKFYGDIKYDVYIGNAVRGELGFPIRGTTIVKNRSFSHSSNASERTIVPAFGSGSHTYFLGDMYYERGLVKSEYLHCLNEADGAPFNDCSRPKQQLLHGIFSD